MKTINFIRFTSLRDTFKDYFKIQVILCSLLGYSSGFSVLLLMSTIPVWLREFHISKTIIGFFYLTYIPYVLKFIWSPFLQITYIPYLSSILGHRKSWGLILQTGVIILIFSLSKLNPQENLHQTIIAVFLISIISATRDIITDSIRVDILGKKYNAIGTATYLFGFRLGMIMSSALGLYIADSESWPEAFSYLAYSLLLGLIAIIIVNPPSDFLILENSAEIEKNTTYPKKLYLWWKSFKKRLLVAIKEPAKEFLSRKHWLLLIILIPIFKISDNYIQSMINICCLDVGYSKSEIATIGKVFGLFVSIAASFIAVKYINNLGTLKTMFYFGIIHLICNLSLAAIPIFGHNIPYLYFSIFLTNFTSGIMTAGFVAFLSELCHIEFTQTQYALFSSLRALDKCLASPSGWLAEYLRWDVYFIVTSFFAVPGLIIVYILIKLKSNFKEN